MGNEDFFRRPCSSARSSCCFFALLPFSLERVHASDVRNVPSGINMRHLVTSRLPSLQFWLDSKTVRVVLAFHRQVPVNSRMTDQLYVTVPVTLLLFRPSESLSAFLFFSSCWL